MPALEEPAPKGNFYLQNELHNFTWVVVLQDGSSKVGASRSASFQLPGCLHEGLLQVCPCPMYTDSDSAPFGCTGSACAPFSTRL
jgi:hypothetical protein